MNALVLRLLAKEPHDRFQTAQEVGNALTVMLGGRLRTSSPRCRVGLRPALRVPTTLRTGNQNIGLLEREAPTVVPKRRSSMAVIAAAVTVAIAAAIVIFVIARSSDNETKPVPELVTPPRVDRKVTQPEGTPTPPAPPTPTAVDPPVKTTELKPMPRPPTPTPAPPIKSKPGTPITQPGEGPVTVPPAKPPRGPVTPGGSPFETDLEPTKKKEPK
jgi:hypothetical protein